MLVVVERVGFTILVVDIGLAFLLNLVVLFLVSKTTALVLSLSGKHRPTTSTKFCAQTCDLVLVRGDQGHHPDLRSRTSIWRRSVFATSCRIRHRDLWHVPVPLWVRWTPSNDQQAACRRW